MVRHGGDRIAPRRDPLMPLGHPAEPAGRTARSHPGRLRTAAVAVWRRRYAVLAAALVAGVLAGLASHWLTPVRYRASVTYQVTLSGTPGAGDRSAAAASVVDLAGTSAFRQQVATRAGTSADDVAAGVAVTTPGSGLVTVSATAADPQRAGALATATGRTLIPAVAARATSEVTTATAPLRAEMADIAGRLDQLRMGVGTRLAAQQRYQTLATTVAAIEAAPRPSVQPGPAPVPAPVPAQPVRDGTLAFLAALVLLAVAIPLVRAARGRIPETRSAGWLADRLGVPAVELTRGPGPTPALAELYRDDLRELSTITVVQLSRRRACDVGHELVKAAELTGDWRAHHDLGSGVPAPQEPMVRSRRVPVVDEVVARDLRGSGPVVLVVETSGARRRTLDRTVSALRAVGAPPVAAVVWRGRLPKDPLYDPATGPPPDRHPGTLTPNR